MVTGGGSGIGAAIASAFAAKGARIAVVDLNADAAQDHAATLGGDSRGFRCDVSDPASVTATVEEVVTAFGRVDVLVNSAGVVLLGPAEELALDAWDKTIDINLKGTFLMCQMVGRHMLDAGAASSSTWHPRPPPWRWINTSHTARRSSGSSG